MVELGARGVEGWWLHRALPLPSPGDPKVLGARIREAHPGGWTGPLVEDESGGWTLPPASTIHSNHVLCRLNSLGFRGPELEARRPGEQRLMVLGDSTCFGHGVLEDQAFPVVAARLLEAGVGHTVTPVNACVPAYEAERAARRLAATGEQVRPDWVVAACIWSDIFQINWQGWYQEQPALSTLGRHLGAWRVTRRLLAPWLRPHELSWIRDFNSLDSRRQRRGTLEAHLAEYAWHLQHLLTMGASLGATPVVISLPAPIDLDPRPLPDTVARYRVVMQMVAQETGALWVDGPAWFKTHDATLAHFMDQVHPSPAGHHLLGEALAETLLREE